MMKLRMNIALKAIQPEPPFRKAGLKHDTKDQSQQEEIVRRRFLFSCPRCNGRNGFKVAGSEAISHQGENRSTWPKSVLSGGRKTNK